MERIFIFLIFHVFQVYRTLLYCAHYVLPFDAKLFRMLNTAPSIKIRSFLQVAPYLAKRGISSIEFFQRLGISPNIFQDRTSIFRARYAFTSPTKWWRQRRTRLAGRMSAI